MRVMRRSLAVALATGLLALSTAEAGRAQMVTAGPLELDLTGGAQIQFNTTSVGEGDIAEAPAATAFETRRIRIGANVAWSEWITGKVEADFAGGGAKLTDGWIDLALSEALGVRAGQFKKPFGVFELESSTKIRTIERGLRLRGVESLVGVPGEIQWLMDEAGYLGRQVGVMVHGLRGPVGLAVGLFNGEGANAREVSGTKAVAARATWAPLEPLVVSGGVSVQPARPFDADDSRYGTAFEVDAVWGDFRRPGLHGKAELVVGENPLLAEGTAEPSMVGAHALVAWFEPRSGRVEGLEPVFRVSWADPDTGSDGGGALLLTPGLNLYMDGRNRLMLNGEVFVPSDSELDTVFGAIAQLQVYF